MCWMDGWIGDRENVEVGERERVGEHSDDMFVKAFCF